MLDPAVIVKEINKSCKEFFASSSFFFQPSSTNRFKSWGDNRSKALNNYEDSSVEIDVIKWFNEFWFFAELRFENLNTFISVSVFQGKENDNVKHQLFRAEWDDYNTADNKHPQPHWHITSNQAIEKTFTELASMDDTETFANLLNEEKAKIIDINKIHFAMCGNWINNGPYTHLIDDGGKIVRWFQGLLTHLRIQLEYVTN
jgi:hypothetical protein